MYRSETNDRPYRITFPAPIILHGKSLEDMTRRVCEYLKQGDKLVFEPLGPEGDGPHP